MKIISRKMQTGKTDELIKLCAEGGGYIVCPNGKQSIFVFNRSKDIGVKINYPITFRDLLERKYHAPGIENFYIDNLDECVRQLTPVPIAAVTMTEME